jgi:uncharacterized membrane protein YbhN (UPF0104 family)
MTPVLVGRAILLLDARLLISTTLIPRRALLATAAAALVALAAWGATQALDPGALRNAFAAVSWPWVAAAGIAYAAGQICSGFVWGVGLRAGGVGGVGRRHVMSAYWIGHGAGELLPAQLGQAVRYAVIRRHPVAGAGSGLRVAGSLGACKVIDGLVTFVVAAVATVVIPLPDAASFLRWVAVAALVGLALLLLVVRRLHPAQVARFLPRRARGPMVRFCEGAAMLSRGRQTLVAIALQLGAVAGRVVSLALLLHAFGMPAAAALLVFSLLVMSGLIAISPGGVGVREAALVPALVATYGMGANTVVAFSLGVQATALGVSLVGAALALLTARFWPARPVGAVRTA